MKIIKFLAIAIFLVLGCWLLWMLFKQEKPKEIEINTISKVQEKSTSQNDLIRIGFPESGEKVGGTINVTGIARGAWYFEGEFPIYLVDSAGKKLADAPALAQGEWMTENFVPFSATLKYGVNKTTKAKLIVRKNNPSDLEGNNASVEIPVVLEPEISSAKIFFPSRHLAYGVSACDKVFPAARSVSESMAYARQALEALLGEPTGKEKDLGYYSSIPIGVKIQNFDSSTKIARVDLSKELLNLDVDVACRRMLITAQIKETIKSVSGASSVIITVDGKPFPGELPNEGPGKL
jgi:hypothetical protein